MIDPYDFVGRRPSGRRRGRELFVRKPGGDAPAGRRTHQTHGQPHFAPPVRGLRTRPPDRDGRRPERRGERHPARSARHLRQRIAGIRGQQDRQRPGRSTSSATTSSSTSATSPKASSRSTSGRTKAPTRSSPPKIGDDGRGPARSRRGRDRRHRPVATARPSGRRSGKTIIAKHKEGDVVTGMVTRKIKGGLLVNIGVNVFLPASQVDIRRPPDIGDYIDQDHRVHDPQDRRGPPQHRRQPPQADRGSRASSRRSSSSPRSSRARSARASSRTSPSSARSSTSAASTACCTSPT